MTSINSLLGFIERNQYFNLVHLLLLLISSKKFVIQENKWTVEGGRYRMKPLILRKNHILWGFGYNVKTKTIRTMLENISAEAASGDVLQSRCS